jgi:hypothetical protein
MLPGMRPTPPGNCAPLSHLAGLFHGIVDSAGASGSLISAVRGGSVAQEVKARTAAANEAIVRQRADR